MELHNLGFVELHMDNTPEAARLFAEAASFHAAEPHDLAMTELERAAIAAAQGDSSIAGDLLAAAEERLREAALVLDPDDDFEVACLRELLAEPA